MNGEDFEVLQVGRCTGTLEFRGKLLEVAFTVAWKEREAIHLYLEPSPVNESTLTFADRLYRGDKDDRRVPYCSVVATTEDGRQLVSHYATIESYVTSSSPVGSTIELVLDLWQIEISRDSSHENAHENKTMSVQYISKGQLGFGRPSVNHELGEVWLQGESKSNPDLHAYTGIIGVDRNPSSELTPNEWLDATDRLVIRVLQVLSLAHGRQFYWEIKRVFMGDKLASITVRPQPDPVNMRAAVFHHLALEPALNLAVTAFTDELDETTGLGIALSWFLSVTHTSESQFLHSMIALEHLVHVFIKCKSSAAIVPSPFFKKNSSTLLNQSLDNLTGAQLEGFELSEQHVSQLSQGLGNANKRSFRSQLEEMLHNYGVEIGDIKKDFSHLVKNRNFVAHIGLFYEDGRDPDKIQLERLEDIAEELLVRIFLTLLDYNGRYNSPLYGLNWRELPRPAAQTGRIDTKHTADEDA